MTARWILVAMLATATVAAAVDFPASVAASKCKGKKKVFGFIDDPTSTPMVRKIKMSNAFYVEAGSAFMQGCRTSKGSSTCQETLGVGLFLSPGVTGEIPCNSQSGLPYVTYAVMPEGGGVPAYWSNTANCTITIVKYDEERGRLKGTYRTELLSDVGLEPVYAELVGCFSAKRQALGITE
jgi:hypothetical protein